MAAPHSVTLVRVRTAYALVVAGAAIFGASYGLVRAGSPGFDVRVSRAVNQVPAGVADVLTPLSRLFQPAAIAVAVVCVGAVCVARTKSLWPIGMCGGAAVLALVAARLAKALVDRPRPSGTVAGAVLRQQPALGSSFPSSHTTVALAVALAAIPYLPRRAAPAVLAYAALVAWSRVYLGVHYPLDVLAGAGLGLVVGGAALLVARRVHGSRPARTEDPSPRRSPP